MGNKRRYILDPQMSQAGSGAPEGRSLLPGQCQPEKQAGECRAGLRQSLSLPAEKKGAYFTVFAASSGVSYEYLSSPSSFTSFSPFLNCARFGRIERKYSSLPSLLLFLLQGLVQV